MQSQVRCQLIRGEGPIFMFSVAEIAVVDGLPPIAFQAESFCRWVYSSIIWFIPTISTYSFTVSHFPWTLFVHPQVCVLIPFPVTAASSAVGIHVAKVMKATTGLRANKTQAPHRWTSLV